MECMEYKHPLNKADTERLESLFEKLKEASQSYSGYPSSLNFDYSELFKFLSLSVNNIGDPYESSNYRVNTHEFEKEVIDFFATLLHFKGKYRGYVTHGGTEGNLYGLYLGVSHYPDGIVYYSESSHYSIEKILRIINAKNIKVAAQDNGEIDYDDLHQKLKNNVSSPAILLLNIGTTMKGAIDDVNRIKAQLNQLNITHYYLHSDAALHGCFLPFLTEAPPFDFSTGIDSIAISGHKFIGSPIPCGITIAKHHYVKNLMAEVAYVKITDSTVSGSRNGITPLFLWYAIKRFGQDGLAEMAKHCLMLTHYVVEKMKSEGIDAWCNAHSNIVVFPRPTEKIIAQWQIATHHELAHLIIMPHHTKAFLDNLVATLKFGVV